MILGFHTSKESLLFLLHMKKEYRLEKVIKAQFSAKFRRMKTFSLIYMTFFEYHIDTFFKM
jgi:hypothetical protein